MRGWQCTQAAHTRRVGTRKVPITELEAFEEAVRAFLQKADAEGTAPRAKEIIAHLRLPDPDLETDMYRLYGPPWNRRLLALWGCERRQASSLPLLEAVKKLGRRFKPLWQIWVEKCLWLLLLLLILAGLGVAIGSGLRGCKGDSTQVDKINRPPATPKEGRVVSSSQYLVVTVDPATMELPSKVTAQVKFPGDVDFHQQYKTHLLAGQSNTYSGFDKAGNYRIEWQPDTNAKTIHGEFVQIALRQYSEQATQLIANLHIVPNHAATGQVVHADATASAPADAATPVSKIEIDWDGKGQLVTLDPKSENHVFGSAGKYPVLLRVTDERGRTATDTAVAYVDDGTGRVLPPTNRPPIAKLRLVSIDTNQVSATVTDAGSVDPDGQIVSWTLDWGDNTPQARLTAPPQNESHSFVTPGEYWVSLTCADNLQAPGHEPARVHVVFPPGTPPLGTPPPKEPPCP
jgi:PKD domain